MAVGKTPVAAAPAPGLTAPEVNVADLDVCTMFISWISARELMKNYSKASKLTITLTEVFKPIPAPESLVFGQASCLV